MVGERREVSQNNAITDGGGPMSKLERLAALHESGALSDEVVLRGEAARPARV